MNNFNKKYLFEGNVKLDEYYYRVVLQNLLEL
jgi:hypothetical protein